MTEVTLYTRPGCHLCEEARVVLAQAGRRLEVHITEVNIDADPRLRGRYDERVPVVVAGGQELEWPFTAAQARRMMQTTN